MEQTAVEWLYNLSKQRELDKFDLEQAKQMEKEQIITTYLDGIMHPLDMEATKQAEQYYNKKYDKYAL
jgi:hypothetical protein